VSEWVFTVIVIAAAGLVWQRRAAAVARRRELGRNGLRVQGRVTRRFERRRPRGPLRRYAAYSFRAQDGSEHEGTALLTGQEQVDLREGDPIEIVHDPVAPDFNRTAAHLRRKGWLVDD
jgi:hypothetical protein